MSNNTVESVKKLILDAVASASQWTTIFGPANGPEPQNQYCLVTLMGIEKEQHDVIKWVQGETNVTENQRSESTLHFEIQARGTGSMTTMDNIASYFDSSIRDVDLWGSVGFGGHDEIQNVNVEHQGKILEVSIMNLYIHTTLPKQTSIQFMNNVDITTKMGNNTIGTATIPQEEN